MKNFKPISTELLKGINLIEASAGTGKTYTIVMLVLRFVVEQGLDIRQILVVTFTKAATEELKARIRNRLVDTRLAIINNNNTNDSNLSQWLDSLKIEPQLVLLRLNNALLDIDQAGIFTIHGFCQRILFEHALQSGQFFDSELTGDISAIKQACSDDFWRNTIYIRSAWEASVLTAKFKTPDELLASVGHISADVTIVPEYDDLQQKIDELKLSIKQNKQGIASSLQVLMEKFEEGKFKDSFVISFNENHLTIIDWLVEKTVNIPAFSQFTYQGLFDGLNGHKFRKSKVNPDSSDEQKKVYIASLAFDPKPFEQLDSACNRITLAFRRSLLKTLHEDISKRLQQLNILSFDDLISRFAGALKGEKGKSLIADIQLCYQVVFIDEFQDTDQDQWFIFSTLFNSIEHTLYLIGDPKQAIYKFRGADIESYFAAKKLANHSFSLGFNWRSHPQLVAGVNALFNRDNAFFSDNLGFTPATAALTSEQGLLTQKGKQLVPLVLWQLDRSEKEFWSSGKAYSEILTAVVSEVLELLTNDFCITKENSIPVYANDIAILVRNNKQAQAFQFALNEVGINAIINSKQSIFSSQEALDLYTLLQAISQPANMMFFKQALTLDWFNLNGQQLMRTLNNELSMDSWLSRFQDYLQIWQQKGLMTMVQLLLSKENIYPLLSTQQQAERRITNLQHCIELVQQAAIDGHLGVHKTLDWLHNNITRSAPGNTPSDEQQLRLESDEEAVKIITMHSAKGLEYSIVFCPFLWQRSNRLVQEKSIIKCHINEQIIVDLGSEQFDQHRQLAIQEELEEDLRVLYVAVTRAKFRCYIHWADVRTKDKVNESAMAYLLEFSNTDFARQQKKLQQYTVAYPSSFEYRLLNADQEISGCYQSSWAPSSKLVCQQTTRSLYSHWQMSSYTALSVFSIENAPELPNDKVREQLPSNEFRQNELPKGAHTGNVIHDLLENISFTCLADGKDISLQRDKSCLHYGLKTDVPEQIDLLLRNTVTTVLTTETTSFCLKQLNEQQCLKEMPFYLSMKIMDICQINDVLQDCPTYQSLSKKTLSGYLTGFIDLICEYEGKFYVMDYKSNSLESYDQKALVQAMRVHNYGLQYWLYTVVLHQYLQIRLSDYEYQQHFGGVKYLFVRGMNGNIENSGVFQTRPELEKIEALTELFI